MIKKILKPILNRLFLVGFFVLLQIVLIWALFTYLSNNYFYISIIMTGISFLVVIYLLNKRGNPTYKMAWIVPVIAFPVVGGLFYLIIQFQTISKTYRRRMDKIQQESASYLEQDNDIVESIEQDDPHVAAAVRYISRWGKYRAVKNTRTRYLPSGEEKWRVMLDELEKAERYIYLEYFIVDKGIMLNSVLDILKRKAAAGVDIRFMYDGMGSISNLPGNFPKLMKKMGIKCKVFSPFVPFLSAYQNNRDHRKICVIDGRVAFTGGINIADEYVNIESRFGHWRDTAVMVEGEAAFDFAVMFLQMWRMADLEPVDYAVCMPSQKDAETFDGNGYVMAYADSPVDDENVSEFVYLHIINTATKYVYITTPYLILDYNILLALCNASKRGVDVRIIIPEIPDKWYTQSVAISYLEELIEDGVRIYKYMPGFIHSKTFVSDGTMAVVGTINLEYRSLYLHYECAAFMYKSEAVKEVYDDFVHVMDTFCHEVSLQESRQVNIFRRILNLVLRLFAPLM